MNNKLERDINNPQVELLFVGALYKKPDLYISYGNLMRSKYDFSDEATKFYYDCFENMYINFSQTIDENKVNIFMSQDDTRLKKYRYYGGYRLLSNWMNIANTNDIDKYYEAVKKYSLIREYDRIGNPARKVLNSKKFDSWNARDIFRIISTKFNQIYTVINANEDSKVLSSDTTKTVKSRLLKPSMGIPLPWNIMSDMTRGCRLGKVTFMGFLSNAGKTRNLMLVASYITLVLGEKFLLLSNEMDEEDLRDCLITTVINNEYFQKLHGVKINKPEKEIVLGQYRDDKSGEFIFRKTDKNGMFIETEDDYFERVYNNSSEYRKVIQVTEWIDSKTETKLFFQDVGDDYSDKRLEFEFRKANLINGVKYCGYDTLKGYGCDDWQTVKQTATHLKEIMKELKMFCWADFQLTDDSIFTDIFNFSSNNIANAKQIKHVTDVLMLGRSLKKEEYSKYKYLSSNDWGSSIPYDLDLKKKYFAIVMDKNRGGSKDNIMLFEINLDLNIWYEIGVLIKRE